MLSARHDIEEALSRISYSVDEFENYSSAEQIYYQELLPAVDNLKAELEDLIEAHKEKSKTRET